MERCKSLVGRQADEMEQLYKQYVLKRASSKAPEVEKKLIGRKLGAGSQLFRQIEKKDWSRMRNSMGFLAKWGHAKDKNDTKQEKEKKSS